MSDDADAAEAYYAPLLARTEAQLAQVQAELFEAVNARCNCCGWIAGQPFDHEGEPTWSELRAERDTAIRELEAVLGIVNSVKPWPDQQADRIREAFAFLLSMREGSNP